MEGKPSNMGGESCQKISGCRPKEGADDAGR